MKFYSSNASKQSPTLSWLAALAALKASCHRGRGVQAADATLQGVAAVTA